MIIAKGKFTVDIYKMTVFIFICPNPWEVTREVNKLIRKYGEEEIEYNCHGVVFTPNDDLSLNYLLLSAEDLTVNTVTHETDHLRTNIIDYCSLVETSESKETSANLNGYINEKVFQFLQKKNINFTY